MANNMSQEYLMQAQRLEQMRMQQQASGGYSTGGSSQFGSIPYGSNPYGSSQYDSSQYAYEPSNGYGGMEQQPLHDPLIYQGVYAPSGFDIMSMLIKVRQRPNPTIDIGSIDQSVALTVCDAEAYDMPIVYCSDPFMNLVGYAHNEIIGKNCRFLQKNPTGARVASKDQKINEAGRKKLRTTLQNMEEACVELVNFTRDGRRFLNVVTTVPIVWDDGKRYVVGFQANGKRH